MAPDPAIPTTITPETLAQIPDDDLWYVLHQYALRCLDAKDGRDGDARLAALPFGLRMVYHLNLIEFEVPNAGFSQFFEAVEGIWVTETLDALHRIGAKRRAEALEKAIDLFQRLAGRPRDYAGRWQGPWFDSPELDAIDLQYPKNWHPLHIERLTPAERTWYDEHSAPEDFDGFDRYVREHPEEFLHPQS